MNKNEKTTKKDVDLKKEGIKALGYTCKAVGNIIGWGSVGSILPKMKKRCSSVRNDFRNSHRGNHYT